jgi:hypothetical protein
MSGPGGAAAMQRRVEPRHTPSTPTVPQNTSKIILSASKRTGTADGSKAPKQTDAEDYKRAPTGADTEPGLGSTYLVEVLGALKAEGEKDTVLTWPPFISRPRACCTGHIQPWADILLRATVR